MRIARDIPVTIRINMWTLNGMLRRNRDKINYFSFTRIPYGRCPAGSFRFMDPEWRYTCHWPHELNCARDEAAHCGYRQDRHLENSDNLLYLNVYTPQLGKGTDLPVMVFFPGEPLVPGYTKTEFYNPDYFMSEGVVVVIVSYRTGVLGFLALEYPYLQLQGNMGLRDVALALKWIRDEICHFGGDRLNVTAFGQGFGAACLHYLLMSPLIRPHVYFQKVIMQSGTALHSWAHGNVGAFEYARQVGFFGQKPAQLLRYLQSLPILRLLGPERNIVRTFSANDEAHMGPIVDIEGFVTGFIPHRPAVLMDEMPTPRHSIPILMGYNSKEGIIAKIFNSAIDDDMEEYDAISFERAQNSGINFVNLSQQIYDFYYGKNQEPTLGRFLDLVTDVSFLRAILQTARKFKQKIALRSPLYLYRFSLDTDLNVVKKSGNVNVPGACHGDELGYLFKTPVSPKIRRGSAAERYMKMMVKFWTNFAKTGDPNIADLKTRWEPMTNEKMYYMDIGKKLKLGVNPDNDRMQFWETISHLVDD